MRESIFANREPRVTYWYSSIVDFFKDFGWEWWLIAFPLVILCFYVLYRVYKSLTTPDMTRSEKFAVIISMTCYMIAIGIMIDIVKNLAGYNKKR